MKKLKWAYALLLILAACGSEGPSSDSNPFKIDSHGRVEFEEGDLSKQELLPTRLPPQPEIAGEPGKLNFTKVSRTGEAYRATFVDTTFLHNVHGAYSRSHVRATTSEPYRKIGRISVGCTGTLVSPRHVLTAGHCVFGVRSGKWYSNLNFTPGKNGSSAPHGTTEWVNVFAPDGWTRYGDWEYDYAIIELERPIGETFGWLPLTVAKLSSRGERVSFAGYPSDKEYGTLWEVSCPKKVIRERKIFYPCDSYGGMSGSAVRSSNGAVEGIHAYGGDDLNSATRISPEIYRQLMHWMEMPVDTIPTPPSPPTTPTTPDPPTPPTTPPPTAPSVTHLAGVYRGALKNTNPESNLPERAIITLTGNTRLSGNIQLYLGEFGSDEYVELKFSEASYNASSGKLTLRTNQYGLVLTVQISRQGNLTGNVFADSLGNVGKLDLKRIN